MVDCNCVLKKLTARQFKKPSTPIYAMRLFQGSTSSDQKSSPTHGAGREILRGDLRSALASFPPESLRHLRENFHRLRPGSFQSENIIFVTYYNAGLRVFDIRNQFRPEEVGYFIPPAPEGQKAPMLNDL